MKYEKSCGAVVFTRDSGAVKYLIITSALGVHGFPKGHSEVCETEKETALREIYEEVGLRPVFIEGFRAEEEYAVSREPEITKKVVYFLAGYSDQTVKIQKMELSDAKLMTFEQALDAFEFESTKSILRAADDYLRNMQEESPERKTLS